MNNKILLTGLVLASLASTTMAAGVGNTLDPNATGYGAEAYGKSNTITATGTSAFAVGFENNVSGANSFAYGHKNTVTGANSFAGGENSEAKGYSSVAIGSSAQALSDYTFAIGSQARTNGDNTVAIGNGAYASNSNALAVGAGTIAEGRDSIAVGSYVQSHSDNNVAIGTSVTTNSNNSVGIGNNVVNNLSNSIGIGNGVATDFNTIGIGNGVETKVQDTIAIGNGVVSNGESSVAIGNGIHAKGVKTVNIGTNVNAKGVSSIVVGHDTTVNGDDTTVVGAKNGTIDADQVAVYGYNNVVQDASKEQLIFGVNSTTKEQGSTVVGSHSKATAIDSLALGNNTIADVQNGVAIGTNSVTESPVGTTNIKDNTTDIRFSNSTYAGSNPDSVVSFGTNGRAGAGGVTEYTRQLQNLAAGRVSATSTDGINGSQLYDVALEAQKHNTLVDGTNTKVTSQDNAFGRKEYKVNVNRDLTNMNSVQFNTVNDSQRNFVSKDGMHVFNGEVNTNYGSNGIKLENTDNLDTAEYNMDGININSNGKNVRFGTDGINAGDQIINNVKAGVADTDAVNVSQLKGVQSNVANNTSRINNLGQKVNTNANDIRAVEHTILDHEGRITVLENGVKDLDNKINSTAGNVLNQSKSYTDNQAAKVGANAAALSALHPLDFNADEKWQFSVGFGNYKGKNATALGAFYQPNENVLLSIGTTLGTGENMINAGATVRFGSHSSMTTNKQVAVAKEVQDLKLQLSAISQKYDNLVKNLSAQKAGQDVDFEYSDLPKDHWAYDFVKKLSDKGYLNGYPDDTFKGDAKMTRYEFAAALWRAVNNGAIIDAQMTKAIKEFEPELEEVNKIMRYRIDTVAGKDNSVHKTERLRVNKNDDPFTHMKRDNYGTKTYTNK
uniref:YadA-like protein n=1 Tax=Myoviridae sp. ctJ2i1 TaxID=2825079 RepID=A0A8S5V1E1_9CAUD|nr:MAG TPA: YadA-like protein [Myoviridae sp. ctJ2i1]